jgi:transposase
LKSKNYSLHLQTLAIAVLQSRAFFCLFVDYLAKQKNAQTPVNVHKTMDAKELQFENQRLKKLLRGTQLELEQSRLKFEQTQAQHQAVAEQFVQTVTEKDEQVAALKHQIKLLLQRIKGSRQERINPDQLMLFSLEELQAIADELEQSGGDEHPGDDGSSDTKRGRSRRRRLPKNMRREIVRHVLSPEELVCPCCGEQRQEFDVVSSEQLEHIPAQWKIIQHDRVKYACPACTENVVIADKPPQPIEKGLPAPGLCAHTVLSKFGDHQPLYRQEDIHSRTGITLRRSTLCGWLQALAELARPLVMRMKYLVLQSQVIHTDDTSIKMLQPGMGIAQTAKFWPYLGDWLHPYAVYDFTFNRERDGPLEFLNGYSGYLQADAYSGYDCIYAGNKVHEVACWVHARRYWHQAIANDELRANMALGFIARLSQIETQLAAAYPRKNLQGERDFAAVAGGRQQYTVPILDQFKAWMDNELNAGRILPKSEIRKAFTYTLNQWDALRRYTQEGYLSYDNNSAERLVKISALGRKNFLFVGNERGGHNAAVHYSLVSSAKANGVEPFAWLRDVFTKLPYHRGGQAFAQSEAKAPVTSNELDELLPDRWLVENPQHKWTIDAVRREERKNKSRPPRRRKRRS